MASIYESPDSGNTVYQREFGSLEKTLISCHQPNQRLALFKDIIKEAESNAVLEDMLVKIEIMYGIVRKEK